MWIEDGRAHIRFCSLLFFYLFLHFIYCIPLFDFFPLYPWQWLVPGHLPFPCGNCHAKQGDGFSSHLMNVFNAYLHTWSSTADPNEQSESYDWHAKSSSLSFRVVLMQLKLTWVCILSFELYLSVMTQKGQVTLFCWQQPLEFHDNDISGRVGYVHWWWIGLSGHRVRLCICEHSIICMWH